MNTKEEATIPLFPQIWNDLLAAKNKRELDRAAMPIGKVSNLAHQRELSSLYTSMKNKFR